ncbi:hypothetical protein CFR76_11160 [Komagataeibacter swingsii]|uniref:Uncharacterized protein n=1 Tax=Komagataeibacter swingsii TaxID=215220 RepID=A0A2V4RJL6_9PROT|nr:hypothetical protein CFR76_11160 [Komagataeibacter swingsii]
MGCPNRERRSRVVQHFVEAVWIRDNFCTSDRARAVEKPLHKPMRGVLGPTGDLCSEPAEGPCGSFDDCRVSGYRAIRFGQLSTNLRHASLDRDKISVTRFKAECIRRPIVSDPVILPAPIGDLRLDTIELPNKRSEVFFQ